MSKVYQISFTQLIPTTINEAWEYFSQPGNLQFLTPPALGLVMKRKEAYVRMYPGQIIEYTVQPIAGIKMYWMTEITHVINHQYFVDEQRYGPYSLWHHQHHFKSVANGVEMTDIITYKIPFWFIGDLANTLIIKSKLEEIFNFRKEQVLKTFGNYSNDTQIKASQ